MLYSDACALDSIAREIERLPVTSPLRASLIRKAGRILAEDDRRSTIDSNTPLDEYPPEFGTFTRSF